MAEQVSPALGLRLLRGVLGRVAAERRRVARALRDALRDARRSFPGQASGAG